MRMLHPVRVRWEELFEDLEGQLVAADAREREALVQELTRAEQASVRLVARVRSSRGCDVVVGLLDGTPLRGRLVSGAETWFELAEGARHHVVPVSGVAWVSGLRAASAPQDATRRLGLAHALRALARDRARVVVRTRAGVLVGRIERVGRDHLDLWVGPPDGSGGGQGAAVRGLRPVPGQVDATVAVLLDHVLCVSEAG